MVNVLIPKTTVRDCALKALTQAEELLKGARILLEKNNISSYALIILGLEEIGKAVLLWKHSKNYTNDIQIRDIYRSWFRDHKQKLDAAFWFHRGMKDLQSLGINLDIQNFLNRIKTEREDSLYVHWDPQAGKCIGPMEWFNTRGRLAYYPQSFDSIKSLLDLAEHILSGAKFNL